VFSVFSVFSVANSKPGTSYTAAMPTRLLPALMPSWRFFDAIGPSPRVDYAWVNDDAAPAQWHEFRPRPAHVPVARMLARLLWNPAWNETLFVVRCAERLMEGDVDFAARELRWRLTWAYGRGELVPATAPALRFRVRAVTRENGRIIDDVLHLSLSFVPHTRASR